MKTKNGIRIFSFPAMALFLIFTGSCNKEETIKTAEKFLADGSLPAWSPDGKLIAYVGNDGLYLINSDGTNKHILTDEEVSEPSWSSSGSFLIYKSYTLFSNLCRINPDGSNKINLTNNSILGFVPSCSPEENQVAFAGGSGELYLMNSDGTNVHNLTVNLSSVSPFQVPQWSPDGSEIMFSAGYDYDRDIYFIGSNGDNLRRLPIDSLFETDAKLSLDGTKIYFSGSGSLGSGIYTINSDGTDLLNLSGNIGILTPRLSPDGTKIVYTSYQNGKDGLYIISSVGSVPEKLSDLSVFDIVWSPDSRKLAFVSFKNGVSSIYSLLIPQ